MITYLKGALQIILICQIDQIAVHFPSFYIFIYQDIDTEVGRVLKLYSSKSKSTSRNIYSSKSNRLNRFLSKSKKVSDKKNYSSS